MAMSGKPGKGRASSHQPETVSAINSTRTPNRDSTVHMPTYSVFPLKPLPISSAQLTAFKTLRLTSLQIDPHAFSSNYVREAAFTDDVWRERLDSPFKRTVIASVLSDDVDGLLEDKRGDVNAGEIGEWIGMASIVGPSGMAPFVLAPFQEAGVDANWEIYALYGMWVHPAHRSSGVGSKLVKECLEWVRTNDDPKFANESGGDFEKVVVLLVYEKNVSARALYSRTGFTDLEGVSSKEGEKWMVARV